MKKRYIIFILIFLWIPLQSTPWKYPTAKGYHYYDESKVPQQKIIIFSYGSLVKQNDNKKTGDILYAGSFIKTSITIPVSFTFLAGYPSSTRRATITIDKDSHDYKPLWMAVSDFSLLDNARNNLAAREGAPLMSIRKGYDLSYIFYLKKVPHSYILRKNEQRVPDSQSAEFYWVTLVSKKNQQLSWNILKRMIEHIEKIHAIAAVWTGLPSNIDAKGLQALIETDDVFVKNTERYIQKLPPDNKPSLFESMIHKAHSKQKQFTWKK